MKPKDLEYQYSNQPLMRESRETLFFDTNGEEIKEFDVVQFWEQGIFPHTGEIQNHGGVVEVGCYSILLDAWRYYPIEWEKK